EPKRLTTTKSPPVCLLKISQHRLAGDRGLSLGHQHLRSLRKEDVEPRAEPDQPEAFASLDRLPVMDEGHDTARDQSGDLNHANQAIVWRRYDERVTLVVLARLVEFGIDELAGAIDDPFDP